MSFKQDLMKPIDESKVITKDKLDAQIEYLQACVEVEGSNSPLSGILKTLEQLRDGKISTIRKLKRSEMGEITNALWMHMMFDHGDRNKLKERFGGVALDNNLSLESIQQFVQYMENERPDVNFSEPEKFNLVTGDIFTSQCDILVNPVNTKGVMGKGLALEFKNKFPCNFIHYKNHCRSGFLPGSIFPVTIADEPELAQYGANCIINFSTKDHYNSPSKMEYIVSGLRALFNFLNTYNFNSIAIPALGCGNGQLEWDDVKDKILFELRDVPQLIKLYQPGE